MAVLARFLIRVPVDSVSSSLGMHVANVVALGSKEQMIVANARGIVAPVKNLQSFWYLPVLESPCHAMRSPVSSSEPRDPISDLSVSVSVSCAFPFPARRTDVYEVEKIHRTSLMWSEHIANCESFPSHHP